MRASHLLPLIGLTGKRGVGKTEAANHLVDMLGYGRIHPFGGGKAAAIGYFMHLGATHDEACRMVHGDLRDAPSDLLPDRVPPRHFLERFGRFMGVEMGSAWTLGAELAAASRSDPGVPIVVESVVYEAPTIRAAGGVIVRILRPGVDGPVGICTDAEQGAIAVDAEIVNDGDIEKLRTAIERIARAGPTG
ncbi:hypothetical protein [Oricola thermophila]|uniref:Deoxynucleotide monophosphate kinase n=1 Tax=Oricola thermophila TaxID=2742145 RepID=A0A6N1VIG8_9HYPH|nr:hypothetical protein [Oricola thermophila]QKV20223.1 hypothetical protein HTY61_18085 [Oricola thermophila]